MNPTARCSAPKTPPRRCSPCYLLSVTSHVPWDNPLIRSARRWMQDALLGWAQNDHSKVLLLAPIAVEHLGKAALWAKSPVLLAILNNDQRASFKKLATAPDLNDPTLRTIGLSEVLDRLSDLYDTAMPLEKKRRSRLVEYRGGAIHAAQFTSQSAQHVLSDALTLFAWLGRQLDVDQTVLFGAHTETAKNLLDERRSTKQRHVDRSLARARHTFELLARFVGPELLATTIAQKEAGATAALPPMLSRPSIGSAHDCPNCQCRGVLLGDVEVERVVDIGGGPDGDEYNVGYDYDLIPDSFYCHVCQLVLGDVEELAIVGLPHAKFRLADDEVTPELEDYARHEMAAQDFPDDLGD